MQKRRIIDCVILNDEIPLLTLRIKYLSKHIDEFVIFESEKTFSGLDKPLNGLSNLAMLQSLSTAKVTCFQGNFSELNEEAYKSRWPVESETRKQFLQIIEEQYPEDQIIFSDVDEIPSLDQLQVIKEKIREGDTSTYAIPMHTYYKYVNWHVQDSDETIRVSKSFVGKFHPSEDLLRKSEVHPSISGIGAHLSYLKMNASAVTDKFNSFSHSEIIGIVEIERFISFLQQRYAVDHIGRFNNPSKGIFKITILNKLPDPCQFLLGTNRSYYRFKRFKFMYMRLVASATITNVREIIGKLFDLESQRSIDNGKIETWKMVRVISKAILEAIKQVNEQYWSSFKLFYLSHEFGFIQPIRRFVQKTIRKIGFKSR